jgi:hypothetical protein
VIRTSILSSLVLSLVLVSGCKKDPPGTDPPVEGGDEVASNSKSGKNGGKKNGKSDKGEPTDGPKTDGTDEEDPTKKVCPAETAEFPEAYFENTVLIRLPKGITAENFVEMAPGFARLSSEVESVSCIKDPDGNLMPGGMISYMALGAFPEDTTKDMLKWRDETLEAFGFGTATISEEKHAEAKRYYQAVLDIPPGDKPEPAKALFQMVAANGFMYAIVIETHPGAWNALKETFYATTAGMKFLPPGA